jgi:hypothetical protein
LASDLVPPCRGARTLVNSNDEAFGGEFFFRLTFAVITLENSHQNYDFAVVGALTTKSDAILRGLDLPDEAIMGIKHVNQQMLQEGQAVLGIYP